MIQDDAERNVALAALAGEIRARMYTHRSEFVDQDQAFSAARATIEAARTERYPQGGKPSSPSPSTIRRARSSSTRSPTAAPTG